MPFKKNDIVTVKIEDLTNLGFGVGKTDMGIVFISGTVPGDVVNAKIIKVERSYAVGKVEAVLERSPLYDESRCSNTACRSCAYKSISYELELEKKTEWVRREMIKAGLSHIHVLDTLPSPQLSEYRNKAQYPVARGKGGAVVGFFAPKSHRVTEAADCRLSPKVFCEIIAAVRKFIDENGITVYDEKTGGGLIRHIYLRRGEISHEVLLTLVINGDKLPRARELVKLITSLYPDVVGILINKNCRATNVILGDEWQTLYGRDYIFDTLAGVKLRISAPSFYQVNHGTAEAIYAEVKRLAAPQKCDTVLDLYCGAGSIGLSLADVAGEIIGVEIIEDAVRCARLNAEENGIKNAHFFAGDAGSAERLIEGAERELGRKIKPDIVVLDPPRAGCAEELLSYISRLSPKKIVYVSCNPATLARDIANLRKLGYDTNELQPMDMFPMTGHVESVICLKRQIQQ